jgi:hypothetical protein
VDTRELALALARGRILIGAGLVLAPGLVGASWIGGDARRRAVKPLARGLGARDVALGLGVVIALDRGAPVRGWLEACALADLVDLGATLLAGDAIPERARTTVALIAGGSAALGAALARQLDPPPPAEATPAPEAAITGHS